MSMYNGIVVNLRRNGVTQHTNRGWVTEGLVNNAIFLGQTKQRSELLFGYVGIQIEI